MNCIKCGKEIPADAPFCCWCGKKQITEPRKALKRPNGTGTVYKLSGKRSRPWAAAKNKTIIGYYARKTDALEVLARLSGRDVTERYNMTFADVFAGWKQEHYRSIGKKGIESYEQAYKIFTSLSGRKFRELRTDDFQYIIDSRTGKSRATLAKEKQLITQLSQWAIRQEIITTNFASFVQLPSERKKEKEIFTNAEISALEKDGSDAAKIVLMLIYTGMRISELFELPLSSWHETYVVGGEKTEAGRNRIIPIRPEGRRYFSELAENADGPLLISGYSGQRIAANFRKRDYYPLLERLKIQKKTPHATRHTYASWAVEHGVKPEILQKVMGHANYTTTADIYVHADTDTLISAVEAASGVSNLLVTEKEQGRIGQN